MAKNSKLLDHPEVQQADTLNYVAGTVFCVAFMVAAYLLTERHALDFMGLLKAVSGLTLLALIAQSMLFYGLSLSREHYAKSVTLALTVPLFVLSIGLTVWMFHTLFLRVMLPPGPGMIDPSLLH
jgi:cytochrome o ubiquinol oxidase operon protein cyoD